MGRSIAAVIAITSSRSAPTAVSSSANTSVHCGPPPEPSASPVIGSILPTAWNWSASSLSAGA